MANEFLITDVVDQQAFQQLAELEGQFKSLKTQIVDITTTIGSGIKLPTNSISEMNAKMQEFADQTAKLQSLQKQMDELSAKHAELLKQVNERSKAIKVEMSYEEQQTRLKERLANLEGEQAQAVQKLKLEIKEKTKEVKRAAQAEIDNARSTETANKSYYEKQEILSSLGRQIKTMNTDTKEEKALQQQLIQQYNELNNELKQVDESMGNFHRNVGNYKNSILEALGINNGFVGGLIDIAEKGGGAKATLANITTQTKAFGKEMLALLKNPIVLTLGAIASALALVSKGISSSEENTKKWNVVLAPFNKLLEKVVGWLQQAASWVLDFALSMEKGFVRILRFLHIFPDLADGIERSIAEAEAAGDTMEETAEKTEEVVVGIKNVSAASSEAIKTAAELASEAVARLQDRYASMAVTQQALYNQQQNALAGRFIGGEISGSQYDAESAALAARFQQQQTELVIQGLERQLEVEELTAEERQRIFQKLAEAKIKLEGMARDASVAAAKAAEKASEDAAAATVKAAEEEARAQEEQARLIEESVRERQQAVLELAQQSLEVFTSLTSLFSTLYKNQMDELDKRFEAETEKYDDMVARGAMTTEEAEARKRVAQEETERKREELAKKQAQVEKAANVASTIMNTAVAIMKAWSQGGIFAAPMVALIAAQGAIQLATILATKAYAKGTDYAAGGLSLVGDGGRSELVLGQRGAWVTPDTPTLVNLHRGDKVLPDAERVFNSRSMMSDYGLLREDGQTDGTPVINIDTMGAEQVKEQSETNDRLEDIRRLLRKQSRRQSYQYIYARV